MIRRCGWCKEEMGRKCGRCGSQKVNILIPGKLIGQAYCLSCAWMWSLASEPETHGICDSCRELAKGEGPRRTDDDYQEFGDREVRAQNVRSND